MGVFDATGERTGRHGTKFGDNASLMEAIEVFRRALTLAQKDREPREWAGTQNNLGISLSTLGERETGTDQLKEAIAAHRQALLERTREHAPLEWAAAEISRGHSL